MADDCAPVKTPTRLSTAQDMLPPDVLALIFNCVGERCTGDLVRRAGRMSIMEDSCGGHD
eukprot:m.214973 g.214973  ORF g.214973 m.214973 type:complete len:60 (-) comp27482_c0_seq1:1136-1315(-)